MRIINMIKNIVRSLTRRLTFYRKLPDEFGGARIVVTPDSMLKFLYWNFNAIDPALFSMARMFVKPGMGVWDIGANLGLFAFAAAWKAGANGKVLMAEADPWLCSLLQQSSRNLAGGGYAELTVASCAVAEAALPRRFNIAGGGRASNALSGYGHSQMGGVRESLVVGGVTLDQLLEGAFCPDIIKIDVEGAEVAVLKGGENVLKRQPIIIIEVSRDNSAEATDLLRAAGYSLFDGSNGLQPVSQCCWSTVAISSQARVAFLPADTGQGAVSTGNPTVLS